jgi:threonine dehydrogenase-like Zn-dependent dehydrogenase
MEEAGKQYRTILPQDPKWNKNAKINREKKRPQTPYFHQPTLDLNDQRLELAKACGADLAINPATTNALEIVHQHTDGYGCDVYIEATGHPAAVEQGLHMLCKLGTMVEFSVMREPVTVDWTIIGDTKELNIHGAHLSPHTYPIAIDMLERGLLPMDQIITHQLPLDRFAEGIELVGSGERSIKVLLQP